MQRSKCAGCAGRSLLDLRFCAQPSVMKEMIYLDANATSRLRPGAIAVLREQLESRALSGNPSSVHAAGRTARAQLSRARRSVLGFLELEDGEGTLVFTSGGTESCNAVLRGAVASTRGTHLVCAAVEHQAVLEPLRTLAQWGAQLTELPPAGDDLLDEEELLHTLRPETALVSLMAANNVTGALFDVARYARRLREHGYNGVIFCDACQAVGKSAFRTRELFDSGVDALAISGHKLGAPTGIGAVVFARGSERCLLIEPLLRGGPQEERLRAGTENFLGALAFGAVAAALAAEGAAERERISRLRDELWQRISTVFPDAERLTPETSRALSNTLALRFPGVRGDDLVVALDLRGVCASTGSACASGKQEPSHVFESIVGRTRARECIRFSLDWDADAGLPEAATERITAALTAMRSHRA